MLQVLDGFSSPISSLKHPTSDEIWIVELSGLIHSWDGNEVVELADLSSLVSTCHVEQGLLGMAFTDDFNESGEVLLSYVEDGTCDGPNESDLVLSSVEIDPSGKIDLSSTKFSNPSSSHTETTTVTSAKHWWSHFLCGG